MITFDNYMEALDFSLVNPNTLVQYSRNYTDTEIVKCHLYNGMYYGVYLIYDNVMSIYYRYFYVNSEMISIGSLTEIQLESIFGECYGNI